MNNERLCDHTLFMRSILVKKTKANYFFTFSHEYQIFQKITKLDYEFPEGFDPLAKDLVQKLLVRMFLAQRSVLNCVRIDCPRAQYNYDVHIFCAQGYGSTTRQGGT